MANGVNKALIIGNLGADPELRYTQSGTAVANISVATSESWKDKQTGQKQEKTEWHRIVLFARLAEVVEQYLKKGSKVYIEGRIQTRKWQNKEGQDVYTTEIVANEMQMLDSKPSGDRPPPQGEYNQPPQQSSGQAYRAASQGAPQRTAATPAQPQGQPTYQRSAQQGGFDDDIGDDIPF